MRPILRPGAHVLRRADHTLQIGLDPQQAVVLPEEPAVRSALQLLGTAASCSEYAEPELLELLRAHDLVLDGDSLLPLIPCRADARPHARSGRMLPRGDVAAVARTAGDRAGDVLGARTQARVRVCPTGGERTLPFAEELAGLLNAAGLAAELPSARSRETASPQAAVLVRVGEPHREVVDEWMRSSTPHLLVRFTEGFATVGPFVVPGRTACLRCVDAHHTDADRSWPLLVEQYASLSSNDRADGVPEPVDALLARVALAWAARDIASHAEGRRPSTWSATIRFDPHLSVVETRTWLRHPGCGCAWG
ncbi:MAG: TOMM precursor leader peptide-binding protein [Nocardioidaceae bacterium]